MLQVIFEIYHLPDKVLGRHDDLLSRQSTENLGDHLVDRLFVVRLQLVFVLVLHEVAVSMLVELHQYQVHGTHSVIFSSRLISSSSFNCMTRKG